LIRQDTPYDTPEFVVLPSAVAASVTWRGCRKSVGESVRLNRGVSTCVVPGCGKFRQDNLVAYVTRIRTPTVSKAIDSRMGPSADCARLAHRRMRRTFTISSWLCRKRSACSSNTASPNRPSSGTGARILIWGAPAAAGCDRREGRRGTPRCTNSWGGGSGILGGSACWSIESTENGVWLERWSRG